MSIMKLKAITGFICLTFVLSSGTFAEAETQAVVVPETPIVECRGGRSKLYDECGSQVALFKRAQDIARQENKVLLVSYGAEWCIWCHVFHAHIQGVSDEFNYTYSDPEDAEKYQSTLRERSSEDQTQKATDLASFFADNFVLVHIDTRYADDGFTVLELSGAEHHYNGWLPFIFSVKSNGDIAAVLDAQKVQIRADELFYWYRGYDRDLLQQDLERLRVEAVSN